MGRAAGGDRLLPAPLRLSRLLAAARRANRRELIDWTRGKTLRRRSSRARPTRSSSSPTSIQGTGGRGRLPAAARRIYVRRRRARAASASTTSPRSPTRASPSGSSPRRSRRSATTPMSTRRNATCMALPTNQPISADPQRRRRDCAPTNQEQAFHPIYRYAVVTDAEEGLILVDVDTLADGEPRNNFLKRARDLERRRRAQRRAPHHARPAIIAYIAADAGLVVVDLDDPLQPRLAATVPLRDARACAIQFRYLWVTDAEGLKLFDVTRLDATRGRCPRRDRAAGRRAAALCRPHLRLCRRQAGRAGDRRRHQSRSAARLPAGDLRRHA